MSNKLVIGVVAVVVIGIGALVVVQKTKPAPVLLGVQHPDQGRTHITRGQSHPAYNSDPASSGWHYNNAGAPTDWGVYTSEIAPEVYIHNEEHGGIIITYNPKLLPAAQIKELQALFVPPYTDPNFKPTKALVFPKSSDKYPIELASWTYTYDMNSYNQATLETYYQQHFDQSPEPTSGPFNTPINQAAGN